MCNCVVFCTVALIASAALSDARLLTEVLEDAGASQFAEVLHRSGVESAADLSVLTDADLENLGFNLVQRRRLQHLIPSASETPLTFGSAGKAITLAPGENKLYNYTCGSQTKERVCILRHMWFGGSWTRYDITRLRVYVDGESLPSIDGQMFLLHGIGFAEDAAPWSSGALFGKSGQPSGIFNTFQIPFASSISITAQTYTDQGTASNSSERFWWIFRGTEHEEGVFLGQKKLPLGARLKLYAHEDVSLPAHSQHSLFSTYQAGAVLMTTLSVNSKREQFLEGEVRFFQNGAPNTSCSYGVCSTMTMSSGTEDYFLGTYYFNRGVYHTPLAGLSHLAHGDDWTFSAYRRHDTGDYVFFPPGGANMTWRCGEPGAGQPTDCRTYSYTLVYQWPSPSAVAVQSYQKLLHPGHGVAV